MSTLLWANLLQRPTRTAVSTFAVAMAVILILLLVGLSNGLLNDSASRTQNTGADILFQPSGASLFFAMNSGTLPIKLIERISPLDGVEALAPVLMNFSMSQFGLTFGIDLESFNKFPGRLHLVEGRFFQSDYEVIIDELFAKTRKLKLGDTLTILSQDFKVAGICRAGLAVVRVFIPLRTMQQLTGAIDKASLIFIKCRSKELVDPIYQRLLADYHGYTITKTADLPLLMSESTPFLKEFTLTIICVSVLISFLVILLAMYTSIFERTREIGILKSMGASKGFIVGSILKESLLICCLGDLLGILLSYGIRRLIMVKFPTMKIEIPLDWLLWASLLGFLGGTLGSLYPAIKAARQDAVVALSHE
jgi:putative ABC transport system permease protein